MDGLRLSTRTLGRETHFTVSQEPGQGRLHKIAKRERFAKREDNGESS